jgi:hypothetical protein
MMDAHVTRTWIKFWDQYQDVTRTVPCVSEGERFAPTLYSLEFLQVLPHSFKNLSGPATTRNVTGESNVL